MVKLLSTKSTTKKRRETLSKYPLLPIEIRELAKLPKANPVLTRMLKERKTAWDRFRKIADVHVKRGEWGRETALERFRKQILAQYTQNGWRVQTGPVGRQYGIPRGFPNPWEWYRDRLRRSGGETAKGYRSPWEVFPTATTKQFNMDLIAVQVLEAKARKGEHVPRRTLQIKLASLSYRIKHPAGKPVAYLLIARNRLQRLLRK